MTRLLWIALAACGSTAAPLPRSPPPVHAAPVVDAEVAEPIQGYCYTSTDPAHYGHCEDTQADCDAAQKLESFARSACDARTSGIYCWWVPPGDAVCAPTLADCERSHANVANSRSCEAK